MIPFSNFTHYSTFSVFPRFLFPALFLSALKEALTMNERNRGTTEDISRVNQKHFK